MKDEDGFVTDFLSDGRALLQAGWRRDIPAIKQIAEKYGLEGGEPILVAALLDSTNQILGVCRRINKAPVEKYFETLLLPIPEVFWMGTPDEPDVQTLEPTPDSGGIESA